MIVFLVSCSSDKNPANTVMNGAFRQSVIEAGELQAINSSTISMPRINPVYGYSFKIISMAEHGKTVKKGEPVFSIDPSSIQKSIIEKREALENEIASANKIKAQNYNDLQELKAQLKSEESEFDTKKLQWEKSAYESEGVKKVIELEYRQAVLKLEKLKRKLKLKPVLDSLDYRIQQIKVNQRENELNAGLETLKRFNVTSPLEGIFVVEKNFMTGQEIKVGDDIYISNPIATIPDIRTMKVKGFIQENDIKKVREGQDVIVRLDALPNVPFHARLNRISRVCIPQDKKKVFLTEVLMTENDQRLKPGMTVSCEYITYQGENDNFVPNNCILDEKRHQYVFVKKSGKIRKTEIKTGPSNNIYTVVSGNIKAGQELVLPENISTR